jgi:hypothetical protein
VQVNGARVKPARLVQTGEELRIRRGEVEFVVTILGLAAKRGPAKVAQLLYEESKESIAAREQVREQRRIEAMGRLQPTRRRAFWGALGGMVPRYLLLAVPVFLALKLDQLNIWATVGGMFMVQAVILLEPLWRSLRAARHSRA